jgi:hypothetical protein
MVVITRATVSQLHHSILLYFNLKENCGLIGIYHYLSGKTQAGLRRFGAMALTSLQTTFASCIPINPKLSYYHHCNIPIHALAQTVRNILYANDQSISILFYSIPIFFYPFLFYLILFDSSYSCEILVINIYSRTLLTRTPKGNEKLFELAGVRANRSWCQISFIMLIINKV